MIRPELDYRRLRDKILETSPNVNEAGEYSSDSAVVLDKDHELVAAIKAAMEIRDRVAREIHPEMVLLDEALLAVHIRAARANVDAAIALGKEPNPKAKLLLDYLYLSSEEARLFSAYVTGPALFSGAKMFNTFSPALVKELAFVGVGFEASNTTVSEHLVYEIGSNAVVHGTNYGENGSVRTEWFGRRNEVLVGFSQPGKFNLKDAVSKARERTQRIEFEDADMEDYDYMVYINEAGRSRGHGLYNFLKSSYSINATYCPEEDRTVTFMHVAV